MVMGCRFIQSKVIVMAEVMVMVMVIRLGLYRSLPRYLYGNSGPVRRERRRASNTGKEEPFLARPHFGLTTLCFD